ncbi:MAG: hypothetical protein GWP61_00775 [Chloroflexi bacterium]|nr:hypothetical protein [Chloroflexota bacterium]
MIRRAERSRTRALFTGRPGTGRSCQADALLTDYNSLETAVPPPAALKLCHPATFSPAPAAYNPNYDNLHRHHGSRPPLQKPCHARLPVLQSTPEHASACLLLISAEFIR